MKRIFPINTLVDRPTWRNYSNYLTWINTEIISLTDYLNYFQKSFIILNQEIKQSVPVIKNTNLDNQLFRSTEDLFKKIIIEDENGNRQERYFIQPQILKWKEGIYNPYYETLILYNSEISLSKEGESYHITKSVLDNYVKNGSIGFLPASFILFAKKWTHTKTQAYNSTESDQPNHYMQLSQSFASIYQLHGGPNKIIGDYLEEGPGKTGTIIPFSFELSPSRYFMCIDNDKWAPGATQWTLDNITSDQQTQIKSSKNTTWINSYEMLSETYWTESQGTGDNDAVSYERFIFDKSWETKERNYENQRIITYVINSNIEDGNETKGWTNVSIVLV